MRPALQSLIAAARPLALLVAAGLALPSNVLAEDGDSYELSQSISQSAASLQGEILKSTVANKQVLEGIASYRAQSRLQSQAIKAKEDMVQPDHMCMDMGNQDALNTGAQLARSKMRAGQQQALSRMSASTSTSTTLEEAHKTSNAKFCTPAEAAQGICKLSTDSDYTNLAGADQDAMYLFQSRDGGDTYEGARDGAQVQAVNGFIARVVAGPAPAEQFANMDEHALKANPKARQYVEMRRRYLAFLSQASYSLNQIKESRNPLK